METNFITVMREKFPWFDIDMPPLETGDQPINRDKSVGDQQAGNDSQEKAKKEKLMDSLELW